ncbi:MAG TPA: type II toxin-antitoxin system prevent-host-death family antitoxin [Gemmatimonadota bacterium]|nr:type II toxin-antitoxin system prevent-host-death family antitoxin [Gemmatimonadota bacterium]
MSSVGAYEAKTRFSALLDRVERGERITITRHGREVAMLVPAPGAPERTAEEAIQALLDFREGLRLGSDLDVRSLSTEGRR